MTRTPDGPGDSDSGALDRTASATSPSPSPDDVRQAGALAGEAVGEVVDVVADTHRAIADRVGTFLPPGGKQVNDVHRTIASAVYGIVGQAGRLAPRVGAEVAAQAGATGLADSGPGRAVLPLVSGFWGDYIAEQYPDLGIPMAVRHRQQDLVLEPEAVRHAFPEATGHVVVFLHGMAGSEMAWWRATGLEEEGETARSYGDRLAANAPLTPVYVRYNSGHRISENGKEFSALMDRLLESWPVPVTETSVVGHSMGGLVARSGSTLAAEGDAPWVDRLRRVITLGSPHGGAPLEQGVNVADWALSKFPETAPLARVLRSRADGVKDLRFGAIRQEDWLGHDPDEFLRNRRTEAPFLPHVAYFFVAATLTADPSHPAGRLIGDGMVRLPSARHEHDLRLPFVLGGDVHLGSTGHLTLLNHPDLDEHLIEWLST